MLPTILASVFPWVVIVLDRFVVISIWVFGGDCVVWASPSAPAASSRVKAPAASLRLAPLIRCRFEMESAVTTDPSARRVYLAHTLPLASANNLSVCLRVIA